MKGSRFLANYYTVKTTTLQTSDLDFLGVGSMVRTLESKDGHEGFNQTPA